MRYRYIVKWKPKDSCELREHDGGYLRPSEAMDFACAVLHYEPADVWIESSAGDKIALASKIRDHCKARCLGSPI